MRNRQNRRKKKMFENLYMCYEGSSKAVKGESAVEKKINLKAYDLVMPIDFGTVYTEKHTFKDFLLSEYVTSDGIKITNQILPDGRRMAEHYDSVDGIYTCFIFDDEGNLLYQKTAENNGKYIIKERQADGSMHEESGQYDL